MYDIDNALSLESLRELIIYNIHLKLTSKTQTSKTSDLENFRPRKLRPRKLRPLDKTIDILKRSFKWTFIYDNDRD